MIKIKGREVLIIGSGPSLRKYNNKIKQFIRDKSPITIGCNNIIDFIIPDYHFWGSTKRWKRYGNCINKKSILIFQSVFF